MTDMPNTKDPLVTRAAEGAIRMRAQELGLLVHNKITEIAGEQMGWVLVIRPMGREGHMNHISNYPTAGIVQVLKEQLHHLENKP